MGYNSIITRDGNIASDAYLEEVLANDVEAIQTVEELYGMIWFLAGMYPGLSPKAAVEEARRRYHEGLMLAKKENVT